MLKDQALRQTVTEKVNTNSKSDNSQSKLMEETTSLWKFLSNSTTKFSFKFLKETNKAPREKLTTTLRSHPVEKVPEAAVATMISTEKETTAVIVKRTGKVTTTPRNHQNVDPNDTVVTMVTTKAVITTTLVDLNVDPTVTVPETIVVIVTTTEVTTTVSEDRNIDATVSEVTVATTEVTTIAWDQMSVDVTATDLEPTVVTLTTTEEVTTTAWDPWNINATVNAPDATVVTHTTKEFFTACHHSKRYLISTVPAAATTQDVTAMVTIKEVTTTT